MQKIAEIRPDDALVEGLRTIGLSLTRDARAKLCRYVELLAKWNRTYNLTAIREPFRMVTHHLFDALAVLPHLPQEQGIRALDVGTGPGVPGIPLAIARPDWNFVLIDSNHKKIAFVTQAGIELSLSNVRAVATRVEDLKSESPFDVVITRAFSDLRTFYEASARFLAPNGKMYAMKGVLPHDEISALPSTADAMMTIPLHVPALNAERHLIVMRQCPSAP